MNKGYLYTIEGVIAALLFLFYIGFILSPPTETDWNRHVLQSRGEEAVNALNRDGVLVQAIEQNNTETVNAVLDAMNTGLRYTINASGLPAQTVDIGVAVKREEVTTPLHTNNTSVIGSGLPTDGEGFALYHNGTVFDVNFTVSDVENDSVTEFTHVNFDFDHNQDFNDSFADTVEGSFTAGDRFRCNSTDTGAPESCDGDDWYTVGNINYSATSDEGHLILYNATRPRVLDQRMPDTTLNDMRIELDFTAVSLNTANTPFPRIRRKDVLYIDTFTADRLNNTDHIRDTTKSYLLTGGHVVTRANLTSETLEPSHFFNDVLGFSEVTDLGLVDTDGDGDTNNTFVDPADFRKEAAHTAEYFHATNIEHTDFITDTDNGVGELTTHGWDISDINETNGPSISDTYKAGNTTIRGETFHTVAANTSNNGNAFNRVYFSTDTTFTTNDENASIGNTVTLKAERLTVETAHPVELSDADDTYHFRDLFDEKVGADRILVERTDYRYNVSEHDLVNIPRDTADPPVPPGVPNGSNVCRDHEDFYKNETGVTLKDGRATFDIWLTNYSIGNDPCQLTYVNFDFNGDGNYNWTGNVSYSAERLWQHNDVVMINNASYKIELDNEELDLRRNASGTVGALLQNTGVIRGSGTTTMMRNVSTGDDEHALLKNVFIRGSRAPRIIGKRAGVPDETAAYSFYTVSKGDLLLPVQGESVWWFK